MTRAVNVVYLVVGLAYYVVTAISVQKLAARTGTPHGWWAWVPILNLFLLVRVAGRSTWEGILLIIPLVNIIYSIAVFIWIPQRIGRSGWWAVPLLIPIVSLAALPALAFSAESSSASAQL